MHINIEKYLEIPFVDGGRDFSGCDCFGLISLIYAQELGIKLYDYKISCEESSRINGEMEKQKISWEKLAEPIAPCILTVRMDANPAFTNHIGFVFKPGCFIHTTKTMGVSVNRYDSPLWERKISGFYLPKEGAIADATLNCSQESVRRSELP